MNNAIPRRITRGLQNTGHWQGLAIVLVVGVLATPPTWASLIGIEVDGCVSIPGTCTNPPVFSQSFTALTATIADPGLEFTSAGAGGIRADFDDTSLTLTVLGGFFDLEFVFFSDNWIIEDVFQTGFGGLFVTSFDFTESSMVFLTENTIGELFPHTATFEIRTAVPEPSTLMLMGIGLAGLGWMGRRRQITVHGEAGGAMGGQKPG